MEKMLDPKGFLNENEFKEYEGIETIGKKKEEIEKILKTDSTQ
jgi:hypothetical protein